MTDQAGEIELRINDQITSDNSGSLVLRVEVSPDVNLIQVPSKTVFVIAYMSITPVEQPETLNASLIADLRTGSKWHGYQASGPAQLDYHLYGGNINRLSEAPPHRTDVPTPTFDYAAVYQRFDLCAKIRAHAVDEVWIWEGGDGGAWEWVTNGPTWTWTNGSNVPNCGRLVTTLNFNYTRAEDLALHSFGHRMEGAYMVNRPCDFRTETWPWSDGPASCRGTGSDRVGFVARPFTGNNYLGVCGDVHHPPNRADNLDYIYNDPTSRQSMCNHWQLDGARQAESVGCAEWACTERQFHIWWMQNIPGYANNSRDRQGQLMRNWYTYLFE